MCIKRSRKGNCKIKQRRQVSPKSLSAHLSLWRHATWHGANTAPSAAPTQRNPMTSQHLDSATPAIHAVTAGKIGATRHEQ
jgi:hypothetical protein